jgi:hypothetical protein
MFFVTMFYALTLGYSQGELRLWEPIERPVIYRTSDLHTDMSVEFRLHYKQIAYLYLGGGLNCASKQEGNFFDVGNYNPQKMDFPFSIGIKSKHVDIGYLFQCSHPIETYLCDRDIKFRREGDYKFFYVKFSGDIRLTK